MGSPKLGEPGLVVHRFVVRLTICQPASVQLRLDGREHDPLTFSYGSRYTVNSVDVTLLYFDDCPNWNQAADHPDMLAGEFPELNVTRRIVETEHEAQRVGFRGSPTILIATTTTSHRRTPRSGCRVACTRHPTAQPAPRRSNSSATP